MAAGTGTGGPLLLGLDCGTSRIRAGVHALDGRCLGWGAEPVPTRWEGADRAWHDPEAIWQAAAAAIRRALEAPTVDRRAIAGIACASVGEAALLLDAGGRALTPMLAWFDRRGVDACRDWIGAHGAERLYRLSGQPPEPILTGCKLEWFVGNEPETAARAADLTSLADYVAFRLGGVLAAERSLACRSGVFDIAAGGWAEGFLEGRGIDPRLMVPLGDSGTALATVLPEAAELTGLPATCVVGVGGHDQTLAAFVNGGFEPGILSVVMGSTEAQVLGTPGPATTAALLEAAVCNGVLGIDGGRRHFLLSGIYTAGSALEWLREAVFAGASHDELTALAEATPPGCHGVRFLPHLLVGDGADGGFRPSGAFWGLGLRADRGALYRAVLEGLAHEGRLCTEALVAAPGAAPVGRIRAAGGDTRNRLRLRIKAAVAAAPVEVVDVPSAAGLGAASMAGLAAGVYRSAEDARARLDLRVTSVEPEPELVSFHGPAFEAYRRAAPVLHGLARS